MLIGDAAGLVDRGEGISKAIISARILSLCVEDPGSYEKTYFMRLLYMAANFFSALRENLVNSLERPHSMICS